MPFRPFSFKRFLLGFMLIIVLDTFVTYHGWWQRLVVIVTITYVLRMFDTWARNEEISRMNPPRSY